MLGNSVLGEQHWTEWRWLDEDQGVEGVLALEFRPPIGDAITIRTGQ